MLAPLAGTRGLSISATIRPRDLVGRQPGTELRIGAPQHLGVHRAGADADRADAERLALDGDRLGETDDPVLGHVVGGQSGELLGGVDAGQRGDVDDPSSTARPHRGKRRATAEERAGQVHCERLLPELGRGLCEPRRRQHAGRADERRERPGRLDVVEEALDVRGAADVGRAPPWPRRPRRGCVRRRRRGPRCRARPARRARRPPRSPRRSPRRSPAGAGDDRQPPGQPVRPSATGCDSSADARA